MSRSLKDYSEALLVACHRVIKRGETIVVLVSLIRLATDKVKAWNFYETVLAMYRIATYCSHPGNARQGRQG